MVYHRVIYMANYMASDTVVERREHMAKATKKKSPPSKIKYEQGHSTVSCRVSRDFYDRLLKAKAEGNSFSDILKLGLGELEVRIKKLEEARKQGWDEG